MTRILDWRDVRRRILERLRVRLPGAFQLALFEEPVRDLVRVEVRWRIPGHPWVAFSSMVDNRESDTPVVDPFEVIWLGVTDSIVRDFGWSPLAELRHLCEVVLTLRPGDPLFDFHDHPHRRDRELPHEVQTWLLIERACATFSGFRELSWRHDVSSRALRLTLQWQHPSGMVETLHGYVSHERLLRCECFPVDEVWATVIAMVTRVPTTTVTASGVHPIWEPVPDARISPRRCAALWPPSLPSETEPREKRETLAPPNPALPTYIPR